MTRIIQYLIQLTARVTINSCLLFCDAPPTCFGPYRPLSGRSFMKEYIHNKCCPRCAYVELKYNVLNYNVAKNV